MKKQFNLPIPNSNEAEYWTQKFRTDEKMSDYILQEKILPKLFKICPQNTNKYEIKVKVKTLNLYYSTNVQATDEMKKHIYSKRKDIDNRLLKGDLKLVPEIANIKLNNGKKRCFYSFATKYCNFHNPEKYPIYDSIVSDLLYYFNKNYKFYKNGKYLKQDLKRCDNYSNYKDFIDSFRVYFKLDKFNYKDIDRYLWTMGKLNQN